MISTSDTSQGVPGVAHAVQQLQSFAQAMIQFIPFFVHFSNLVCVGLQFCEICAFFRHFLSIS
jgi:cephalosporin-C deacetylase-like acetyl esterase